MAFAIFDRNKIEAFGKIVFKGNTNYEKVSDASKKLYGFFKTYGKFEAVVIEHTVFMNSPKTAADLALVQGAILGSIALSGASSVKSINPIAWQTFIGNGRLTTEEKKVIRSDNPGKSDSWYKTKEREIRKQKTIKISLLILYFSLTRKLNTILKKNSNSHYVKNTVCLFYVNEKICYTKEMHLNW
jgi:hypothetical protein